MAANMQQMAAPGQIMPQQLRKQQSNQLGAVVYQSLLQQPPSNQQHDLGISLHERMGKTMSLLVYPQATLAFAI